VKVTSCALVASTNLEKALGTAKEVTGGADTPSAMMAGRPAIIGGHTTPLEVGQPSPARQSSPAAQGRGSRPIHALSTRSTIGKENRLVMPTRSSTSVPLVKHDTQVDLNLGSVRIRYTQESPLVLDSPPSCYIASGQRVGAGYGKVLIPNLDYKGKGRTELASSNPTPRVQ
jgi:hypothetical protein